MTELRGVQRDDALYCVTICTKGSLVALSTDAPYRIALPRVIRTAM